jgi:hypothetical protein
LNLPIPNIRSIEELMVLLISDFLVSRVMLLSFVIVIESELEWECGVPNH